MTTDPGELLFERYLVQQGYEILDQQHDFGTGKKPDYLIQAAGHELVVEVKSFNTPPMPLTSSPSGFVRAPELRAVRRKISDAAAQLKGIDSYPVVVVLTNPRGSWVPLAADQVIDAMYGDKVVTFDEHGKLQWRTGRNGRLHVDEPDDSVRGSHPHLSAVAVLRHANTQDALVAAWLRQHQAVYQNVGVAIAAAFKQVEETGIHGELLSLDVFETVSKAAVPVPPAVFAGKADTRWGVISEGRYARLVPPMEGSQ